MSIDDLLNEINDIAIFDSIIVANKKINNSCYGNIMCSVSGGSDSDIIVDICQKLDSENKITYVFFDTGLEYQATKEHLQYLESKYGIEIVVAKAKKPIPICCKQYGQPFLSKQVSEWINRLQRHKFKWEDKPFEELLKEYPRCKASLKWWCNRWDKKKDGSESNFNIAYNKYLKEFMILNPPQHPISNKCCYWAKKAVAQSFKEENNIDLSITGIRKAEGGARATAYKNCFTSGKEDGVADEYRIIFYYKKEQKRLYEDLFGVCHSRCYSEYGLERTGCAGCPCGQDFEQELEIIRHKEPKLYKAVNNIFGDSYEYTRKYREFVELQKSKEKQ